tara:strand:+ start:740 stop:967 length:228 start_codon:yes stop_codon:yes gene_type:complete
MAFFEPNIISSLTELKEFSKDPNNISKKISFNNLEYILVSCSKPEIKYGDKYECVINSVSSTWKDGNGLIIHIAY